ncbi:MAG: AMP-binding protein [Promethearchaeota archaeon]|jgi:acyl-CoA synthetase (AMP-forming)/AMP-acid ligase II
MTQGITEKSPYSTKIWLKSYDDHVKPKLDFEIISLAEMMKNTVNEFPDSLCYDFQAEKVTFQEAERYIISFANFLIDNGLKKGDRLAIMLPNLPQYFIGLWGTFYAACTSTGMNFLLQIPEIIYQLKDSGAIALLTLDSFYEEKVRTALESGKTDVKLVITTNVADVLSIDEAMKEQLVKIGKVPIGKVIALENIPTFNFKEILDKYPSDRAPEVENDPINDIAFLQYTGGTTGPPKGAILTHENILYNIKHTYNWFEPGANRGHDVYISGFPFFHLAGMSLNYGAVHSAAAQILIPDPRDTSYFSNKAKEYQDKISLMCNVPTLYLMLMGDRKFRKLNLREECGFLSGAAPFPSESIKEFEEIVGKEKVIECYGMTEASPIVTFNPYLGPKKIGTVGIPVQNTDVKIVNVEDGKTEVPIGEPGEIVIKGPQIFKGYWNKPRETEHALREGWFYSGDVGVMDEDGYITIVDRTKDMINVSGFKVFSVEVDDKMNKHPAIELCATVGVPDKDRPGSEYVKLYALLKEGHEPSDETKADILKYAQNNLAKYKVPRLIEIVKELPLTTVGKVDKKVLRKI